MPKKTAEKEVTIPEVKRILESTENLSQFQLRALEYAKKFSKPDADKAEALVGRLISEFDITRGDAVQIVNCMPKTVEELRVFFAASKRKIVLTSRLEEMLKVLDEYR